MFCTLYYDDGMVCCDECGVMHPIPHASKDTIHTFKRKCVVKKIAGEPRPLCFLASDLPLPFMTRVRGGCKGRETAVYLCQYHGHCTPFSRSLDSNITDCIDCKDYTDGQTT
jgi:hypothetical protein